jgi:CBS domain-containing protein
MAEVVQDIMTKDVVTIEHNQTALNAAELMTQRGISSLIVLKENRPVGIITERDFVKKICVKELQVSQVKTRELMSKIRTFADADTPIEIAVQRMANHKIRRLPIMADGKVIGMVTVTDLAKHLRKRLLIQGAISRKDDSVS